MRSRIWLLLAGCIVTFLAIGLWTRGAKKEGKKDVSKDVLTEVGTVREPQQAATKKDLPKKPLEEPREVIQVIISGDPEEVEEEIGEPVQGLVTIRGPITSMDPCFQTIMVDGTTVDVSSYRNFPMYRTYHVGHFVEVTYREKKSGNVLHSIEVLQER